MSVERTEPLRLAEQIPDGELPGAVADLRRRAPGRRALLAAGVVRRSPRVTALR